MNKKWFATYSFTIYAVNPATNLKPSPPMHCWNVWCRSRHCQAWNFRSRNVKNKKNDIVLSKLKTTKNKRTHPPIPNALFLPIWNLRSPDVGISTKKKTTHIVKSNIEKNPPPFVFAPPLPQQFNVVEDGHENKASYHSLSQYRQHCIGGGGVIVFRKRGGRVRRA